jgi:basic membrane protein A
MLGLLLVLLLSGCNPASTNNEEILNIGMLLARGGLGDRSFNDSAYEGLQEGQRQFNIRFQTADFTTDEANLEALRGFAREDFDLIIGVGFENAEYIKTVASEFPEKHFAIIDVPVEGDNVASTTYREQEGDFLMGVLAAMLTKSGKVGFVGGVDIPIIQRMEQGFKQGVAYQNDQVEVVSEMAGTFSDPEVGKEIALAQYEAGVDIIYNAAGRTGLGVVEAAKEQNKLTIGTSGDQRYLAPGNVVGNRPKRVDTAILTLIEQVKQGQFKPGTFSLGLKEGGLSIGPFDENIVSDEIKNHLTELEQKIINSEITIQVD